MQAKLMEVNKCSGQEKGRTSNIMEPKKRGLDQPAVRDIATGAIWWRSVQVRKRGG